MEGYPTLARRFLIRTLIMKYKKMLDKAKIAYNLSDKRYEELCERFLNPEYVCEALTRIIEIESDSESDSNE